MSHSCNVYDSLPWGTLHQQLRAHTSAVCYFSCLIGDHCPGGALEKLQGGHKVYKTQKYVRYEKPSIILRVVLVSRDYINANSASSKHSL